MKNYFKKTARNTSRKTGFTLIEVLVVTGIAVVLLLTAVSFFITFLVNQSRVTQKQQLKNAGESVLKQMTQTLREAREITECDNGLIFSTINNNQAEYSFMPGYILYILGDDRFRITPEDMIVESFVANCYHAQDSQLVKITFSLNNPKIKGPSGEALTQEFSTTVQLRN